MIEDQLAPQRVRFALGDNRYIPKVTIDVYGTNDKTTNQLYDTVIVHAAYPHIKSNLKSKVNIRISVSELRYTK